MKVGAGVSLGMGGKTATGEPERVGGGGGGGEDTAGVTAVVTMGVIAGVATVAVGARVAALVGDGVRRGAGGWAGVTAGPTAGAAEEGMVREAHWAWLLGATTTAEHAYSFWARLQ